MVGLVNAIPVGITDGNERTITIISQDYIDKYFEWNFTQVTDNTIHAQFNIMNGFLVTDYKACRTRACSNTCWTNIKNTYFPNNTITQVCNDMKNITNYPRKSTKGVVSFSGFNFDTTTLVGNFDISFADREDTEMKLGFGSTVVGAVGSTPWLGQSRSMCLDNQSNIYTGYRYNDSILMFHKSTDGGISFQSVWNMSLDVVSNRVPFVACSGSNIAWGHLFNADLVFNISTDNGVTWTGYGDDTNCLEDYTTATMLGNRLYIVCKNLDANTGIAYHGFYTNGTAINSKYGALSRINYVMNRPTIAAYGTGNASDKIVIFAVNTNNSDIVWSTSSDGGTTWGTNKTISSTVYMGRGLTDGTTIWYSYIGASTGPTAYVYNTTWTGSTMTSTQIETVPSGSQQTEPSIMMGNDSRPCVFMSWYNRTGAVEREIGYECMNTTRGWGNTFTILNATGYTPRNVVTPFLYYNDYKYHYIFRDDAASDTIVYDNVAVGSAPLPTCFTPANNTLYTNASNLDICGGTYINTSFRLSGNDKYFNCSGSVFIGGTESGYETIDLAYYHPDNIVIKNCIFTGRGQGNAIYVGLNQNTLISNITATNFSANIQVDGGGINTTITDSNISGSNGCLANVMQYNGQVNYINSHFDNSLNITGCSAGPHGIYISPLTTTNVSNTQIINCTLNNNYNRGLHLNRLSGGYIINLTVTDSNLSNNGGGVDLYGCLGCNINNNHFEGNSNFGASFNPTDNSTELYITTNTTLNNNTFYNNNVDLKVYKSTGNVIINNRYTPDIVTLRSNPYSSNIWVTNVTADFIMNDYVEPGFRINMLPIVSSDGFYPNYTGKFSANIRSIQASVYELNMSINNQSLQSPYDDVYNITSGSVSSYNIDNYTILMKGGYAFGISNFSNSCTCPGFNHNWEVDMAENCVITTNCSLGVGILNFTGIGNFYVNATISTLHMDSPPNNSVVWMRSIGLISLPTTEQMSTWDLTGNGHNAVEFGSVSYNSNGYWDFAGSNGGLNITNSSAAYINMSTGFTITAWINRANTTSVTYPRVVSKDKGNTAFPATIYVYSNINALKIAMTKNSTETYSTDTNNSLLPSQWNFVAVTYDNTYNLGYVNGNLVINRTYGGPLNDSAASLIIGNSDGRNRAFNGSMRNVHIYNRSLTKAELDLLQNNVTNVTNGQVVWLLMGEQYS
jgi:hypothetical protein